MIVDGWSDSAAAVNDVHQRLSGKVPLVKPIVKTMYSSDIDEPLDRYVPPVADNFGFDVRLIIGDKHRGGEESLDIVLCTPRWLEDHHAKTDVVIGRPHVIVFEYNYHAIFARLAAMVERIEADTWDEVGAQLSRWGLWEFDDYRPAEPE